MIEIYCKLIIGKRRTFDQVPDNFKAGVEARLIELGYTPSGDSITSWVAGADYTVGQYITYGTNGAGNPQPYKVIRAHTSIDDWAPDVTPSLFTPIGLEA